MDNERVAITVCGDGGTGKSSISLRLVRSKWTHDYDPTIEDSYSVTRIIDGVTYHLHLTDTAGQEEYRGLWSASNLRDADAFLLVYDITNHDSLVALDYFNDLIQMDAEERPPEKVPQIKFVAGNKCDLAQSRQVSSAEGLSWARSHDCGFMETSARNMVNIEETFALIVRRVVTARQSAANGNNANAKQDTFQSLPVNRASAQQNSADGPQSLTVQNATEKSNDKPSMRSKFKCCVIC